MHYWTEPAHGHEALLSDIALQSHEAVPVIIRQAPNTGSKTIKIGYLKNQH